MDLLRTAVATSLALSLSACCFGGGGDGHAEKTSQGSTSTARSTATIAAPNNPDGSPRRGIVRAAADFKAAEVARLNNGTSITVLSELHGGWLQIEWTGGAGFIHHDVVKR